MMKESVNEVASHEMLNIKNVHVPAWKAAVMGFSFMSIGLTIGLSPAYAVTFAGSGGVAAQILGLVVIFSIAVAVSAYAKRYVATGSLMSYAYFVFGRWGRAIVGGCQLCGYLVMLASITAVTQVFVVGAMTDLGLDGSDASLQLVSIVILLSAACFLTCRGLEASIKLSMILAFACIPPVLFVVGAAILQEGVQVSAQFDLEKMAMPAIIAGAMSALAFSIAFEGVTTLAAETNNPKRNVPRLLFLLVIVIGGCAILATLLQSPMLLREKAALDAGSSPIALLAQAGGVEYMQLIVDLLLVPAGFSAIVAVCTFGARVIATAASDGLLPAWLGRLENNSDAPSRAAIFISLLSGSALVLPVLFSNLSPIALGAMFGSAVVAYWLPPYLLICVGAIVLEIRHREYSPFVIFFSALGALTVLYMISITLQAEGGSEVTWIPYLVIATSLPLAIVFYLRSGNRNIHDF